jgi:hypothetical protein
VGGCDGGRSGGIGEGMGIPERPNREVAHCPDCWKPLYIYCDAEFGQVLRCRCGYEWCNDFEKHSRHSERPTHWISNHSPFFDVPRRGDF